MKLITSTLEVVLMNSVTYCMATGTEKKYLEIKCVNQETWSSVLYPFKSKWKKHVKLAVLKLPMLHPGSEL